MDYVPTPAAAFQSSAQRISRVFACLQSSISSMHHITRSTCLGELPASLCHCASQKSCRPWSSWPACQYSAGIRSLPRRAACHLLSSRGLRPWSSCQPACILQASVRAGASCVPSPCHREIFVPGRAASLPAFCRHPFVPGRASVPSPSIARSSCLVELPACLQVCKRPFVPRRASCHLLSSRGLRACSSYKPACILHASVRDRASCVPHFCHRASQNLRAWSSCQPACILQASARAVASCVPESCHRASQGLRAWSSCQPACILQASVRARASCVPEILPSRIARSPCLVKLPACLHSAGIRSRWGKLRGRLLPSRIARSSVPGRAASLPAFCRHPFVPGRAACHHLSSRDLRIWSSCQPACILQSSARAVVSCVPDSCHHASQSLRAWSSYQPACILQASARAVASCVPDSCHHASQGLRAWSSYQPACILQASARAVASGVPESCHRASQGLHAWSSCQPACRLLPSRIAKSPCLVKLPACLHSAGIRSCCGELRARILCHRASQGLHAWSSCQPACILQASVRARASCVPESCHRASQDLRAWSSCQPACILQASVRAGANCVADSCHRASQGLRAWSSCQPACILQASVRARASCVPSPVIARSSYLVELSACLHSAVIHPCRGERRAISYHREVFVPGRAASLPAFCRHPFVPGRAACHHLSSRGSSYLVRAVSLPAFLQSSARAVASCVPDSCHHASQSLRALVKLPACLHSAGIRSCCGELRARILPSRIARSPCLVELPACLQTPAITHRKVSVPGQATSLPAFCRHPLVLWRAACQTPAIAHRKVSHAWSSCQPACRLLPSRIAKSPRLVKLPACLHSAGIRSCCGELRARILPSRIARSPCLVSCQPACILQASVRAGANCVADSCHRASQGLRAWSSCQPACILQASVRARASCVPSPVIARSSYLVELSACLHSAVIRSCCGELRARLLPSRIAKSPCLVKLPACLHSAGHPLVRGELRARILPSRIARSPCLVKLLACPHSAGIRSCHGELRARLLPSRIGKSSVPGRASSLPAFCRHPFVPGRAACQNPAIAHRKVSVPGRSCQPACILQTSVRCRGELRARLLPSRIARSPCLVILQASIRAGVSCVPSLVIARSSCLVKLPACLHSAGIRSCRGELRAVRI
ncbi:uncharacterized protein [Maniola hyperantus]|uniref:uncharacterized protein isoform X21 n=1 Tax=Aphantopus hyperantus TaxID=2795564 RepID=UPI00374A604D